MHVFAFTFLWTITEKDANYNIRRRLMINSKIPQGGLWHTKKGFFGVPFKFVINILKLLTYPGTYYEESEVCDLTDWIELKGVYCCQHCFQVKFFALTMDGNITRTRFL